MKTSLTTISEQALAVTAAGIERENWHAASRALIAHSIAQRFTPARVGYMVTYLSEGEAWTRTVAGFMDGGACTVDSDGRIELIDTPTAPAYMVWNSADLDGGKGMTAQRAETMLCDEAAGRAQAGTVSA